MNGTLSFSKCVLSSVNTQSWWGHSNPTCCNYIHYRAQTKLREGNIFTPVCDCVHGGGGFSVHRICQGSLSRGGLFLGVLCPQGLPGGLCPGGLCPGWSLSGRHPVREGAGNTHLTGMHSCLNFLHSFFTSSSCPYTC